MKAHFRRNTSGQSLPLIALMIVVIIAMVGLSVDVGNAYGQQRQLQNAANAAALSAMSITMGNRTNQAVWDSIKRTLAANRIDPASDKYRYKADYIFADKPPQLIGQWNMTGSLGKEIVPNADQTRPLNVIRVQVTLEEVVDTYFARVVGRETLPVNVNGNACPGGYGIGVYPIGVPRKLNKNVHRIYHPGAPNTPLATDSTVWNQVASGEWDKSFSANGQTMVGMIVELLLENKGGGDLPAGSHIGWLNWGVENKQSNDRLTESLTYPGNLQDGFSEGENKDTSLPSNTPNGRLELLDWIEGTTGVQNSNGVDNALQNHIAKRNVVILPMYNTASGNGANSSFYITKMGKFQLIDYNRHGNPKYIRLMYLGDAPAGADGCAKEVPDGYTEQAPPKVFGISGTVRVNRVWRTGTPATISNDIVIVMDTSGSMRYDWKDKQNGVPLAEQRITAAKQAIKNFVQQYDLSADPEARMSFITFGGYEAVRRVDWTTACAVSQIASDCGGPQHKWQSIQQAADQMTPDGYTPGPFGFEKALQQLQTAQTTRASGKPVRKFVIFATDGVFNVCGSTPNTAACRKGELVTCPPGTDSNTCVHSADFNLVEPRPVWQGQQRAAEIKAKGASIFTIALKPDCPPKAKDCFDPKGLPEMSSGSGYHYQVSDAAALNNIFQLILSRIDNDECAPREQIELAPGAKMTLYEPGNPTVRKTTVADGEGHWEFTDLPAGQYIVKVDPYTKASPEDGLTRTYARVRNALDLGEEGQVSFNINPQWPNRSFVYGEALISLHTDANGNPLNGCTTP